MADEEKTYPPSETKLSELRDAGIYPVSRDLDTAAVLAGLLVGCMLTAPKILAALSLNFQSLGTGSEVPDISNFRALFFDLSITCLTPMVLLRIASGFFQSRWHLSWPPRRRFHRLLPAEASFRRRLSSTLLSALKAAVWLTIVFFYFAHLTEQGFPSIANAPYRTVRAQLTGFFYLCVAVSFVFGIIGVVAVRLQFRTDQGMSRREVEAESREFEAKPEMRRARNERRE